MKPPGNRTCRSSSAVITACPWARLQVRAMAAHEADRPLFVLWLDAHRRFQYICHDGKRQPSRHATRVRLWTAWLRTSAWVNRSRPALTRAMCASLVCDQSTSENESWWSAKAWRSVTCAPSTSMALPHSLGPFLERVEAANGLLHVSLDVDFIEPEIAPAVGTTVPGGATFREAHLVMEMLHDSGLLSSLDLVELNPFLDDRGRTARLMVDLTASLFGRRVWIVEPGVSSRNVRRVNPICSQPKGPLMSNPHLQH